MPELPEVETVRRGLERLIVGKKIEKVDVLWGNIIVGSPEEFVRQLIGREIEAIQRRGKYLLFFFDHDLVMISHLRMEGKYALTKESVPLDKHTHVLFHFTDGGVLRYNDVRKFGRMQLVTKKALAENKSLKQLGPEPVLPDFSLEDFYSALQKKHKEIKPVLLEQKVVAGIGNIYADEILWEAQIHPQRRADQLSHEEVTRLHTAIIKIMAAAVKARGTTIRSYQNAWGDPGSFQLQLQVYGKTNEPCSRCGTPIVKIKVAQRGTHFCPHCQQLKSEAEK